MPLCRIDYFSEALQKATSANVILPSHRFEAPYPVLFLLHGLSDDFTIWQRRTSIERYVENTNLLVVMPDGGRGFYCDDTLGFDYGKAIGEELPNLIRHYFPVIETPWAISGLSMGGYGAIRLACVYPKTFGSAHSHSGAVGFAQRELGRHPEFQRILGDNPLGGPCDLYHLVQVAEPTPALSLDCGTEDFLLEDNREFVKFLESKGIDHEYSEFPGAHEWSYWDDHVQEGIDFHRNVLGW